MKAIAYGELSKPEHLGLIRTSISDAKDLLPRFTGVTLEELAVEIAFLCRNSANEAIPATGIVQLFQHLQPGFEQSRICIKIPSTWEGMMACRALEMAGVRTLATTLFTMSQAILAAEVGCTYIAPYVNQLKVHFEPG
ncbi:hypothetical protein ACP6JC_002837 [Aspergillus fumigatus]